MGPVRYAPTIERVFEESVMLFHRNQKLLSDQQQRVLAEARVEDPMLVGRRVLVVDDDLRNIFALTSVLELRGMQVLHAENGRAGIDLLKQSPEVDIVLMDIMMPEMDGYETMRTIRKIPEFRHLPIIALTAKAMKGDREKCLRAGASDYVTKPVDLELLFSVMRVWVARDTDDRFEGGAIALPNWLTDHELIPDDDRASITPGDPVLLVVEDDPTFARILMDRAHEHGFKALLALRGASALALLRNYTPTAITLDVGLPDMSGWTVLDHLKHDPATRHIPVHVLSSADSLRRGFAYGASTCLPKGPNEESLGALFPVVERSASPADKCVLLITGSDSMKRQIQDYLATPNLTVRTAASGYDAIEILAAGGIDGVVLDWAVSEAASIDFIEEMQRRLEPFIPPIAILGVPETDSDRISELGRLARTSSIRFATSLERLLDETLMLLHCSTANLNDMQKAALSRAREIDPVLAGRRVLVIDDDIRNIFALTSALEQRDMTVLHAGTGREGIDILRKEPDIDIVLMDIMMPEMDGYQTARAIRQMPQFLDLPIVALTAKAMRGDRERCLQAGASDYVTKPVDLAYLFSVMRVWLTASGSPLGASIGAGRQDKKTL
jgi:CheY-like chemotaxis protein